MESELVDFDIRVLEIDSLPVSCAIASCISLVAGRLFDCIGSVSDFGSVVASRILQYVGSVASIDCVLIRNCLRYNYIWDCMY